MNDLVVQAHDILRNVFGYTSFKTIQEDVILKILEGDDCLVILPTGGGKSLCYQIPALVFEDLTIVISPLIALMEDQVVALQQLGINAEALHSNVPEDRKREVHKKLEDGMLRMLYMAPESLLNPVFLKYIQSYKISLIAIDEAHCISVWGNDFRPEYTKLSCLKEKFTDTPLVALTATADEATRTDIVEQLKIPNATRFIDSFERQNITTKATGGQNRIYQIQKFLSNRVGQSGIIYCLSRKNTEKVAGRLQGFGVSASFYHAGMNAEERKQVQTKFQNDEIKVVCATIAFGMGIDKSNVRFVIHYNLPKNIESYYQEIGRAGRDGEQSETLLFYSWADMILLQGFIDDSQANDEFKRVQRAKLDRIWEFANATSCRTNLILNYFGEFRSEPCGHCDNCMNPPELFDGSKYAQMALSAVVRTKEEISFNMLIDILKGSGKAELRQAGYDKIKTYGVGRSIPYPDWKNYITQIINQGFLSINFKEKGKLKITPFSRNVLKGLTPVMLSKFVKDEPKPKRKPQKVIVEDELFEILRKWRLGISQSRRIPAYAIFNDQTLQQLAAQKPTVKSELIFIDGIGPVKLEKYGDKVLELIRNYILNKEGVRITGKTQLETLDLFKMGNTIEQIAEKRTLSPVTIAGHLADVIQKGESINIDSILNSNERDRIIGKWNDLGRPESLKSLVEELNGEYHYGLIRLALSHSKVEE